MHYPQTYPPDPVCRCGHGRLLHFLSEKTKKRTNCSVLHGGKCKCKQYEEADA